MKALMSCRSIFVLALQMALGSVANAQFTLTPAGDVGIGTTTPQQKLHVNGNEVLSTGSVAGFKFRNRGSTTNADDWVWYSTGNIARFWRAGTGDLLGITTSGNVGIGTTTPGTKLEMQGGADPLLLIDHTGASGNPALWFQQDGATKAFMWWDKANNRLNLGTPTFNPIATFQPNGNVGIATPPMGFRLDVAGRVHASGFPTSSDRRFKTNVTQLTNVLEKLDELRAVSFEWNKSYKSLGRATGKKEIGLIAQQVEPVFPELVTTWGDENYRAVDYGRLAGVLVEAVNELKAEKDSQIAVLKSENASLKKRYSALEERLATLEKAQAFTTSRQHLASQ